MHTCTYTHMLFAAQGTPFRRDPGAVRLWSSPFLPCCPARPWGKMQRLNADWALTPLSLRGRKAALTGPTPHPQGHATAHGCPLRGWPYPQERRKGAPGTASVSAGSSSSVTVPLVMKPINGPGILRLTAHYSKNKKPDPNLNFYVRINSKRSQVLRTKHKTIKNSVWQVCASKKYKI